MGSASQSRHKPRELRRRVVLPARMRIGSAWSDACILNISTRGLLIHTSSAMPSSGVVELRRGEHVIVARVAWREGSRAGLCAEERVPVEEIMTLSQATALQLTAAGTPPAERRTRA